MLMASTRWSQPVIDSMYFPTPMWWWPAFRSPMKRAGSSGRANLGRCDAAASSLTCVHWATQPEDPFERVEALRALDRVVAEGSFPTLRGFTLWKLSTDPGHRAVEPFVVVLPSAGRADDSDEADRLYLEAAATLARRLRDSAAARR